MFYQRKVANRAGAQEGLYPLRNVRRKQSSL